MAEQRDPIQQKIDSWRKHRVTKDMVMDIIAPNSYNDGLTIENVFRDAAPTITDYLDWADGKDIPPEELAWDLVLSFPGLPMAARAGKKLMKFAKKAGKGGFIVDPKYVFRNEKQRDATNRAVDLWNKEFQNNYRSARPADMPAQTTEYAIPKINEYNDAPFRYGKLPIKKTIVDSNTGKTITDNNIDLAAIYPEDAAEAGFVRHAKTDYKPRYVTISQTISKDPSVNRKGRVITNAKGLPEIQYQDKNGNWVRNTQRARDKMWHDIAAQMPGYANAITIPDRRFQKERGLLMADVFSPDIDKRIARQQADMDFWNTLLKNENFMKSTPDPNAVYQKLEDSRKKLIELQNLKTEQTLDALD